MIGPSVVHMKILLALLRSHLRARVPVILGSRFTWLEVEVLAGMSEIKKIKIGQGRLRGAGSFEK